MAWPQKSLPRYGKGSHAIGYLEQCGGFLAQVRARVAGTDTLQLRSLRLGKPQHSLLHEKQNATIGLNCQGA